MIPIPNIVRGTCLVIASLTLVSPLSTAQVPSSLLNGQKSKPADQEATDPLRRETPRSAIFNFLQACHRSNYQLASQYFETTRSRARDETPADLAKDLCSLLDRNPNFEVNRLSSQPEGNVSDGLPTGVDLLATFQLHGNETDLLLQRNHQNNLDVWLVDSNSLPYVPQLTAELSEPAIAKHLPDVLVETKLMATPLWVWLALVLIAFLLSVMSRWLSQAALALVKGIGGRYVKSFATTYRIEALMEPVRLLLSVAVFRICMFFVPPSALVRGYLIALLILLYVLAIAAILMRIADIVSDRAIARLDARQKSLSYSVIPLLVRITKILIFCFAIIFVLARWGYSTSTILAGLGVGGLAVALAAQKTIENLFGSLSIISDRPVLVGDVCQFGGQQGTVEDIGLRSTRIRTLDRTVVTIPNSVFSTMTLENYSRRDRMWFHPTLRLARFTSPRQIEQFMAAVTEILRSHPKVDPTAVPVRFTKVAIDAFDFEVFAYVLTPDSDEFLRVQTQLLMAIVRAASELEVSFAVPIQRILQEPLPDGIQNVKVDV